MGEAKQRRFADLIATDYERIFVPQGRGGPIATAATCDCCGREAEQGSITAGVLRCASCHGRTPNRPINTKRCDVCREEVVEGEVDGGTVKCATCVGFEDLGQWISRVRSDRQLHLTVSTDSPPDAPGWQRALAEFGYRYSFGEPQPARPDALVYRINDTAFRPDAHGFRFLNLLTPRVDEATLATWPDDEPSGRAGDVKSFRVLAHQSVGLKRLGVLRMDVDSLGTLFAKGLGEEATIARLATLSRMLRLFFEGWLNEIGERVERDPVHLPANRGTLADQDRLYAIYTGGDDLFVVGSWDRLPLYAAEVRRELAEFAGDNPAVTISAGLVLADANVPLYQSADQAKHALDDEAKEHRRSDGRPKDAISIFDHTLGWEAFGPVEEAVSRLQTLIEPAEGVGVPRALLAALAGIAAQYDRDRPANPQPDQVHYGRWSWLAAYTLQRQVERLRAGEQRDRLKALVDELRKPHLVPHLGLIARWAEFLVRTEDRDATLE